MNFFPILFFKYLLSHPENKKKNTNNLSLEEKKSFTVKLLVIVNYNRGRERRSDTPDATTIMPNKKKKKTDCLLFISIGNKKIFLKIIDYKKESRFLLENRNTFFRFKIFKNSLFLQ